MAEPASSKTLSPTEKKIKAGFGYSFNDIAEKIVAISCATGKERSAGSGFIARQEGKTYLFTNQHVVFGADRISFKTATGRALHPASVELSARRDIVRLLLPDSPEAFEITDSSPTGTPVAVFGNSEGGGVATEIYGKTIAEERDTIEVSALFVSGNSGSPVLDSQQNVLGIASYVSYFHGDKTGSKTRRFCYRVAGAQWKASTGRNTTGNMERNSAKASISSRPPPRPSTTGNRPPTPAFRPAATMPTPPCGAGPTSTTTWST
jgi:S1-C subfamily serine protease